MKKLYLFLAIVFMTGITGCKKQLMDRGGCYECKQEQNGTYKDVGCMSADEWKQFGWTDINGNDVDKYQYCRKRR